jgi:hypothetical protein
MTTEIQFQASSKKLFNLQKFWLLLENGCISEDGGVVHDNNTNYAVVYSVDNNVQGHFNTNFTYSLSKFGKTVLSDLRILADCEVTWVQLNGETRQSEELQVSHRNIQSPLKLLTVTHSLNIPDFGKEFQQFLVNIPLCKLNHDDNLNVDLNNFNLNMINKSRDEACRWLGRQI